MPTKYVVGYRPFDHEKPSWFRMQSPLATHWTMSREKAAKLTAREANKLVKGNKRCWKEPADDPAGKSAPDQAPY